MGDVLPFPSNNASKGPERRSNEWKEGNPIPTPQQRYDASQTIIDAFLSPKGWISKERSGTVIWQDPNTGYWYSRDAAVKLEERRNVL